MFACSVALDALTPGRTPFLAGLPFDATMRAVFFILCVNPSTCPLVSGHPGVTFRCLNTASCAYSPNLRLLRGGHREFMEKVPIFMYACNLCVYPALDDALLEHFKSRVVVNSFLYLVSGDGLSSRPRKITARNVDMRVANQATPSRHTQHPAIDGVISELSRSTGYEQGIPPT